MTATKKNFHDYPVALEGPYVPFKYKEVSNPIVRGRMLEVGASLYDNSAPQLNSINEIIFHANSSSPASPHLDSSKTISGAMLGSVFFAILLISSTTHPATIPQ